MRKAVPGSLLGGSDLAPHGIQRSGRKPRCGHDRGRDYDRDKSGNANALDDRGGRGSETGVVER
jgi:hypothetical protein